VDRLINKDTEMHPLVRWQFRGGIPEEDPGTATTSASGTSTSNVRPSVPCGASTGRWASGAPSAGAATWS
jgi:hypothetical protein